MKDSHWHYQTPLAEVITEPQNTQFNAPRVALFSFLWFMMHIHHCMAPISSQSDYQIDQSESSDKDFG